MRGRRQRSRCEVTPTLTLMSMPMLLDQRVEAPRAAVLGWFLPFPVVDEVGEEGLRKWGALRGYPRCLDLEELWRAGGST